MDFPNPPVWELDCGERITRGMEITCPTCQGMYSFYNPSLCYSNERVLVEGVRRIPQPLLLTYLKHVFFQCPTLVTEVYRRITLRDPPTPLLAVYQLMFRLAECNAASCLEWFCQMSGFV